MGKYEHMFDTVAEFDSMYNSASGYNEPWLSYTVESEKLAYSKDTNVTLINSITLPKYAYLNTNSTFSANDKLYMKFIPRGTAEVILLHSHVSTRSNRIFIYVNKYKELVINGTRQGGSTQYDSIISTRPCISADSEYILNFDFASASNTGYTVNLGSTWISTSNLSNRPNLTKSLPLFINAVNNNGTPAMSSASGDYGITLSEYRLLDSSNKLKNYIVPALTKDGTPVFKDLATGKILPIEFYGNNTPTITYD